MLEIFEWWHQDRKKADSALEASAEIHHQVLWNFAETNSLHFLV